MLTYTSSLSHHTLPRLLLLLSLPLTTITTPSPGHPTPGAPSPPTCIVPTSESGHTAVADLGYGKYRGVPSESYDGVTRWVGLRYARPPVGELRFAGPRGVGVEVNENKDEDEDEGREQRETMKDKRWGRYGVWSGESSEDESHEEAGSNDRVWTADTQGPICHPVRSTLPAAPSPPASEDCLFLDIYAPTPTTPISALFAAKDTCPKLLPVLVNIQGGGFSKNANPHLDGSPMAVRGMVVVTFNYRVGVYGFLAGKEVAGDATAELNVGLLDQRMVLRWVKRNIIKFGGDPFRIIIAGSSAGGASVLYHLTTPMNVDSATAHDAQLFHGTIAQSPSFGLQLTPDEAQYQLTSLLARANCDSISCLRSLSTADLQNLNTIQPYPSLPAGSRSPVFMYSPVIDGPGGMVEDYTYRVITEGKFMNVPLMVGDNEDEGSMFVPRGTDSEEGLVEHMRANFPDFTDEMAKKVADLYPEQREFPGAGKWWWKASQVYGEMRYNCAALFVAQEWKKRWSERDVWLYRYNTTAPAVRASGYGVLHTQDTTAVWDVCVGPSCAPDPENVEAMRGYWESFVKALNPNKKGSESTQWGPSEGGKRWIVVQDDGIVMEAVPPKFVERCKWWKSVGLELRQ